VDKKASLVIVLTMMSVSWAVTKSAYEAQQVVKSWLASNSCFCEELGQCVSTESYADARGILYHVVKLDQGYVIVSPDDTIEPIIAFSSGVFDASDNNPLMALVNKDLGRRLAALPEDGEVKWDVMAGVDEVIVAPLTQSRWGQSLSSTSPDIACYNFYTPQVYWNAYPDTIRVVQLPGDPWNFPAGCVATAMAQVMYYHQYPPQAVGPKEFTVGYLVSNRSFSGQLSLMGGPYQWGDMTNSPGYGISDGARRAIGELCYDAGVSVGMHYGKQGSGTKTALAARALTQTFQYQSAVSGEFDLENVNPNLDQGYPVLITIRSDNAAHSVVIDGYGLQRGEQYHHLNMGWKGSGNTWYNLPNVGSYEVIDECVYNIFPSSTPPITPPVVPPVIEAVVELVTEPCEHTWAKSRATISEHDGGLSFVIPCEDCDMVCTATGEWQ
jgi:hypothetical protein